MPLQSGSIDYDNLAILQLNRVSTCTSRILNGWKKTHARATEDESSGAEQLEETDLDELKKPRGKSESKGHTCYSIG